MIPLNWLSISFIIAAGHGIFLLIVLWDKNKRQLPANRYLLILLGSVVASLLLRLTYSENNSIFLRFPHLTIAGDFAIFVIGPVLYFYTRSLLDKDFKWEKRFWKHFIPLGLFLLSYFYLMTISKQDLIRAHVTGTIYPYYIGLMSVGIVQISVYAMAGMNLTMEYQRQFWDEYAEKHRIWYLQLVLAALFGVVLCWIPAHFYSFWGQINLIIANFFYQVSFLLMSLLVFIIGFYAIKVPEIFSLPLQKTSDKYRHSKLNKSTALAIKQRLFVLLEKDKAHLDSSLSLQMLAQKLSVNHVHLSQVINEYCGKNFYDLINEFRVNTFIEKAQSGEYSNYTLLAIALESGFKSKTSFNKAFKKVIGTTPSQFLKADQSRSSITT